MGLEATNRTSIVLNILPFRGIGLDMLKCAVSTLLALIFAGSRYIKDCLYSQCRSEIMNWFTNTGLFSQLGE